MEISDRALDNVTIHPWMPRSQSDEMHAACDVAVISLVPGMLGLSVPSRIYSVLASGRPIIGVVEETSELERLLAEEPLGWWVRPGDVSGFVTAVRQAEAAGPRLLEMGSRARQIAERDYSTTAMIARFAEVLREHSP